MLIPSGNNIASMLARWDAGSDGAFVAKMNARARSLGLHGTRYADASGADPATVSTASDQFRLTAARAAASGVPPDRGHAAGHAAGRGRGVQRQFQPRARRDRGRQDRLRRPAGGCLSFAAIRAVAGSQVTIVGVVLGVQATSAQPSELGGVISAAENLLTSVGGDLEHAEVVRPGAVLGSVSSAWAAGPAAVAATGVSVTAWPGTPVTVTVTPRPLAHAISQGQPIARATVTVGSQVSKITLDASQAAPAPSVRWLLTRL